MEGAGINLNLTPDEVEQWMTTLRRAACLLEMYQAPMTARRVNRDRLHSMADRLEVEVVRRAAWDAELEGTSLTTLPAEWPE